MSHSLLLKSVCDIIQIYYDPVNIFLRDFVFALVLNVIYYRTIIYASKLLKKSLCSSYCLCILCLCLHYYVGFLL
jgi:hypothetical protein